MHYLSVYCRFRDEASWLREWIEYYRLIGVDHFYMVDHLSKDNPREILDPYIKRGIVTYVRWEEELDPRHKSHYLTFLKMGNHVLALARGKTKWLGVFDSDEFLVTAEDTGSVKDLLRNYEQYPGVVVNWQMHGTNGIEKLGPSDLLIEKMTRRAPRNHKENEHVKTIVQPALTDSLTLHDANYKDSHKAVTTNYQVQSGPFSTPILTDKLRLHHYFFRDRTFMREVKMARRKRFSHGIDMFIDWDRDFSSEYDPIMIRHVTALRKRVIPPNWKAYLAASPDLQRKGIVTEAKVLRHWFHFGVWEGRKYIQ